MNIDTGVTQASSIDHDDTCTLAPAHFQSRLTHSRLAKNKESPVLKKTLIAAALGIAFATPAVAQGPFAVRLGFDNVNPKSNNGTLAGTLRADVDSNSSFTFGATYFFSPSLGIDFQTALRKFEHEVRLNGVPAAEVEHRPTTLQLQYFFGEGAIRPYVGAGWGWTSIEPTAAFGPLRGANLSLDNANGFTVEAGADIAFAENFFVRLSAEYLSFESDAFLNGAAIGTVDVNPWILGASVGYTF